MTEHSGRMLSCASSVCGSWAAVLALQHHMAELQPEDLRVPIPEKVPSLMRLHPSGKHETGVGELVVEGATRRVRDDVSGPAVVASSHNRPLFLMGKNMGAGKDQQDASSSHPRRILNALSAQEAKLRRRTRQELRIWEPRASSWPLKRLVPIWNDLPGVLPVQKLTSRKIALERIWRFLHASGPAR